MLLVRHTNSSRPLLALHTTMLYGVVTPWLLDAPLLLL
jgi:hypothetical protein